VKITSAYRLRRLANVVEYMVVRAHGNGLRTDPLISEWETKVCRYNWHSTGSRGWPFPMLKYKIYICQIKYTEAILSTSTGKLLWSDAKMLTALLGQILQNVLRLSYDNVTKK